MGKAAAGFSSAILVVIAMFMGALLISGCQPKPLAPAPVQVNALTFYHWWTSPGEASALAALVKVYTQKYPDTAVVPSPVIGGAGYNLFSTMLPMVKAGQAPDSFQVHAGYEAKPYFDAGLLAPVDDVWAQDGLKDTVPAVIQDMCKYNGSYYLIPVGVHRSNLIWYNKQVLDNSSIDPESIATWDDLFAAAAKLKANGMQYPIQMGESWTAAQVFETIIASEGIDVYQDWANGKITSPDDPRLVRALATFKKYMEFVNPDHKGLSWDEVTKRISAKEGAFYLMGDWANGEFALRGMVDGKDYGVIPAPGTSDMYGLVIDTFERPKGILHPANAANWLEVVGSKEGQDTFNPLKGSISARSDSDATRYGMYQRAAIADFWKAKHLYPSVVHGSGAPESFKVKLSAVIEAFSEDGDAQKAAAALTGYTAQIQDEYTINWHLG